MIKQAGEASETISKLTEPARDCQRSSLSESGSKYTFSLIVLQTVGSVSVKTEVASSQFVCYRNSLDVYADISEYLKLINTFQYVCYSCVPNIAQY